MFSISFVIWSVRQLKDVVEVSCMSPEELLLELQALQLEAMYDRDQEGSSSGRGKKPLGSMTEQFLIDQVGKVVMMLCKQGQLPLLELCGFRELLDLAVLYGSVAMQQEWRETCPVCVAGGYIELYASLLASLFEPSVPITYVFVS